MKKKIDFFDAMTFKNILIHPNNRKHLEYLIETFLELPRYSLKGKIIVKNGQKKSHLYCDFDEYKLLIYTVIRKNNPILHFYYMPSPNFQGKWIEYRKVNGTFQNIIKETKNGIDNNIIEAYHFTQATLNKLDCSTSLNRWLKFIWASKEEERLEATKGDEFLTDLLNWLKKQV